MQTMYPGMVNSPITELAQAISDTDTTIELLNGAALPEPPNIAVIGQGETLETIQYNTKIGNVLEGVTRGFQGMPQAWGQGTKIGRYFTEYDYRALKENIEELQPLLSQSIMFVSKSGDDSNSGDIPEKAKLTIQAAVTAAAGKVDGSHPQAAVVVLDAGRYSETVTLQDNVHLFAEKATLIGRLNIRNHCKVSLYAHYASENNQTMLYKDGTAHAYYSTVVSDGRGLSGTITGASNIYNITASSILFTEVELMFVAANGMGVREHSSTTGHIHFDIKDLYLANGSRGVYGQGTASNIIGKIDHILKIGGASNTTGIQINNPDCVIKITAEEVIADTAYNIAAGELYLNCPKVSGAAIGIPVFLPASQQALDSHLADLTYQVAGGTATDLVVDMQTLVDGYSKTFIAASDNNGAATTINDKLLYKPNTTDAPSLVSGKAYTVWYSLSNDCFFIKASAEGTAVAGDVLAGKTFSNDDDAGIQGAMPNRTGNVNAQSISRSGTILRFRPQEGYYLGDAGNSVQVTDANFIAANIRQNVSLFGLSGNLAPKENCHTHLINLPSGVTPRGYDVGTDLLWGQSPHNDRSISSYNSSGTLINTVVAITSTSGGLVNGFSSLHFMETFGGTVRLRARNGTLIGDLYYGEYSLVNPIFNPRTNTFYALDSNSSGGVAVFDSGRTLIAAINLWSQSPSERSLIPFADGALFTHRTSSSTYRTGYVRPTGSIQWFADGGNDYMSISLAGTIGV